MINIKNFFKLSSSLVLAQILTFVLSPVISRLYSPAEFGAYTTFIVCVSIFGPILSGKYEMAIIQSKVGKAEEENLIKLSLLIGLFLSILVSMTYASIYFNSDVISYVSAVMLLFLLLFSYALSNVFTFVNNNREDYKTIGYATIIRSFSNNVFSVFGGLLWSTHITLVFSQILSSFQGIRFQKRKADINLKFLKKLDFRQLQKVSIKYRHQALGNAPAALLSTTNQSSILLLSGLMFGTETLGLFAIAIKMLSIPNLIISTSIHKIFFKEIQKKIVTSENINFDVMKTFKLVSLSLIPIYFLIAYASVMFIPFFLGMEWARAGKIMLIMTPWFYMKTISDSFSSLYVLLGKQYYELRLQLIFLLGMISIYAFTFIENINSHAFLVIYVVYSSIYLLVHVVLGINLTKNKSNDGLKK
ncbi:oligosaccharide flippase family protein [Exiguobacterium sp. s152]|uniref:lipopolysaccharide biosynthesis protein n=1 Tax=Exiguobacterium sp. s152 TaxID=2751226 RepID=UPI001BEA2070|nr:oligosaccharide flippase family protein [Exiguobacterium sp. s152]